MERFETYLRAEVRKLGVPSPQVAGLRLWGSRHAPGTAKGAPLR